MKIQGNGPREGLDVGRAAADRASALGGKDKDQPVSGKPAAADSVNLSSTGKEVADLISRIDKLPDVRQEKVRALQDAVNSGNYSPDAKKIAAKMLDEL